MNRFLTLALKLILLPGLLVPGLAAHAATSHHPLDDIRATVRDFVLASLPEQGFEYNVVTERLDPRLRLSPCNVPLKGWFPGQGRRAGNITVGVRCDGNSPWSIYVPVKVNYFAEIVVARQPLERGTVLNRNNVRLEKKNISYHADNYFTRIEDVIGRELVHSLQMGFVLSDRNLKLPEIISRGQEVTLLARTDTFEVRMSGTAMMNGVAGQRIKVRNNRSERIVEGVVKSGKIIYIE